MEIVQAIGVHADQLLPSVIDVMVEGLGVVMIKLKIGIPGDSSIIICKRI